MSPFKAAKTKCCQIAGTILNNFCYKIIARPLLFGLPSATIAIYKIEVVRQRLPTGLTEWLDKKVIWVIAFYFFLPVLVVVEDALKKKALNAKPNLSQDGYTLLTKAIDYPVERKMNRFVSFLAENGDKKITPSQIFKSITKPEEQLAEIVRSIHIFFEGLSGLLEYDEIDFQTVLFKMDNHIATESWCYFPKHQPPEPAVLNDKDSLAFHSSRSKSMIIVDDIKKEKSKKKSKISNNCPSESGSAICYPIKCTHRGIVPLVIRIVSSKPFFEQSQKKLYAQVLERFEKRILIEYALSELKENASRQTTH